VGAGCYIGAGSSIGAGSQLQPNVTIMQQCSIGEYVRIHSGAVIGAEGFGFAPDVANPNPRCKWQRIAQLGRVLIGDYVRIGAGTTIDRGALDNTVIGHGVILDNQIQIAHNVQIGDFTAIAGQTGIAGSATIGKRCMIAGGVGIAGHLSIADDVSITAASMITKSISVAGSYSSGMAFSDTVHWRKTAVAVRQLPDELPKLKAQLAALQQQVNQIAQALAAATNPSDMD
jgi:UDP-3-O-[3-hydroxymyristoyl] glucosamine N-acyltransferase